MSKPTCRYCNKTPDQIEEFVDAGKVTGLTPTEHMINGDITYSPFTNKFSCTDCWIDKGMPTEDIRDIHRSAFVKVQDRLKELLR